MERDALAVSLDGFYPGFSALSTLGHLFSQYFSCRKKFFSCCKKYFSSSFELNRLKLKFTSYGKGSTMEGCNEESLQVIWQRGGQGEKA
jgi:hypothetical protein